MSLNIYPSHEVKSADKINDHSLDSFKTAKSTKSDNTNSFHTTIMDESSPIHQNNPIINNETYKLDNPQINENAEYKNALTGGKKRKNKI